MKRVTLLLVAASLVPIFILNYTSQIALPASYFLAENYGGAARCECLCNSTNNHMVKTIQYSSNFIKLNVSYIHTVFKQKELQIIHYWDINFYVQSVTTCFCKNLDYVL